MIEQMCESVGIEPSLPRLCAQQRHRTTVPAENACEYYQRVISVPLLDYLISELHFHFSAHHQTTLQGLSLIPAILVMKSFENMVPKVEEFG